jgi:hypothetical protein
MLARVENGAVTEYRDIAMADVPPHKRHLWREVDYQGAGDVVQETVSETTVRVVRSEPTLDLATAQHQYCLKVDADAGIARGRYISGGTGMDLVYVEKFQQAQAVNDLGEDAAKALADPSLLFPTLAASVGVHGATIWDCAHVVLKKYAEFARLSFEIERTREIGKQSIREASDVAGVKAAYAAIAWSV